MGSNPRPYFWARGLAVAIGAAAIAIFISNGIARLVALVVLIVGLGQLGWWLNARASRRADASS
jgi:hypothetical protein